MSQKNTQVTVNDYTIEKVDQYVTWTSTIWSKHHTAKSTKRIGLSKTTFGPINFIFSNSDIRICVKRRVYESCKLPVTTYGLNTLNRQI